MKTPLISLSVLVIALQACSGKPTGFQGDTASASHMASTSGDATGRAQGNRDSESGDAMGSSGEGDATGVQAIETAAVDMDATSIFEGTDTTISVPASSNATSNTNTSTNSSTASNSPANSSDGSSSGSTSGSSAANSGSSNAQTTIAAPLTLTLAVPTTSLRSGSSPMQAMATLSNSALPASVTWTAQAGTGQATGTIDEYGVYTAPASGGGYAVTITATLNDDPSIKASVAISIVKPEVIFVGCQQGSEFFPITADVYQLPANTTKLPDFAAIGAKLTTVCMDQYNVAPRDWSAGFPGVSGLFEWFALHTTSTLTASADGVYNFKLNSDDGAKLYIDGNLVINNDGQHAPTAKDANVTLTAGDHAVTIDYFQGPRYQIALELYWKIPGAASYVYVPKASFK